MQPFTWTETEEEEEEGRLSGRGKTIPGAGIMKNKRDGGEKTSHQDNTISGTGLDSGWAGLTGAWLQLGELRDWLGGVHHVTMHVYTLGVLLKSKLCCSRFS